MITAEQIIKYVERHREEAIRCLRDIVKVPSVTGEEEAVSKVFTAWIESTGLAVTDYPSAPGRPNLVSEWTGSQPGKRFVFNGHMDVFPPSEGDVMPYGPWDAVIDGGFMYGRGTADMKAGDAAALMAVKFLRELHFDPKGTIVLTYVSDEENGGWMGVKHLIELGLGNGDFGICMEPSSGDIIAQHWGILRLKFVFTAEHHHAGTPHPKLDALEQAIMAANRFYALDKELNKIKDENGDCPCLSVTMLHSGNTINVQPGYAELCIDRRFSPDENIDDVMKQILDIMEDLKASEPNFDYTYELKNDRPALNIPFDDPFVQLAADSYEQIMGKRPLISRRPGGSDAANLRQAYGISMPNWSGSGEACRVGIYGSGGSHERIDLQDYVDTIKYYMMTVVNAMS